MSIRLLRIATRRNVGLWLCPLIVAFCLLAVYGLGLDWSIYLWPEMSEFVGKTVLIIGPCIAGTAAWMAGRESRCGLEDLLATTPRPAFARQAATWSGTVIWGLSAYIVAGAILIGIALRHAVWGGPTWWPMAVGLLAVPAYAAVGYVAGASFVDRFAPPFIAFLALLGEIALGVMLGGASPGPAQLSYLSPTPLLDVSVWYGVRPNVGLPQGLSMIGITVLCLGVLARREGTRGLARGLLAGGGCLAVASVLALIVVAPAGVMDLRSARTSAGPRDAAIVPYTPACAGTPLPVCMHPAYRMYLRGDAAVINRLTAPLRGIPGAPTRAAQSPGAAGVIDGVLAFVLSDLPTDDAAMPADLTTDQSFFGPIAVSLVGADAAADGLDRCSSDYGFATGTQTCLPAQEAIGIWLVRQAGLRLTTTERSVGQGYPYFGNDWAIASAAARRFAALTPAQRHVWLLAHYRALRLGRLPLSALP